MEIQILGTGDAFSKERYNTCFVLNSDGFNLAVECPHPYLKILKDKLKIEEIDHFIISHMHADHMSGLETIAFYKKFVEGKKLNLYGSGMDLNVIKNMYDYSMGRSFDGDTYQSVPLDFYFDMKDIQAEPVQIGPFTVTMKDTDHYIPSNAMIISDGDYSVGYSGDTKFDIDLINWLDQADLIIHEVGAAPGHTPYEDLMSLPKRIRDRIYLIHYSDQFYDGLFDRTNCDLHVCMSGTIFYSKYMPVRESKE